MHKLSLIISVYNKVSTLELILTALSIQSFKDFEVLIADDGSGENMKKFISDYKKSGKTDITHIHHDDKGFRKNKILNEAIKKSRSEYLVFIDGDCIPHSDFLHQHYLNRKKNTVLCGRRVNLSKRLSDEITTGKILSKDFEKVNLKHFYDSWRSRKVRSTFVEEGLMVRNKLLRKLFVKGEAHIVGCNFSLHRELIEKINGFDENYTGPGIGEDSDIEFRLRLAGSKFGTLRNLAILFHIYHKATAETDANYEYFEKVQMRNDFMCENGLVKIGKG
jgi:glycosyltransferase involved in cell wall biosynthesis